MAPSLSVHTLRLLLLLVVVSACSKPTPTPEVRFEEMSVPQSFGWNSIRNLIISVNTGGKTGMVMDLADDQNRRIDRQVVTDGRAVFNVRISAELPGLRIVNPISQQYIDVPLANLSVDFAISEDQIALWEAATDSDNDSIPDAWDDYPNDSSLAIQVQIPHHGWHYVLFDEAWPNIGDYDFNDAVIAHRFTLAYDARHFLRSGEGRMRVIAHSLQQDYGLGVEFIRSVAGTTYDYAFDQTIQFTGGIDTSLEKNYNTVRFFNSFNGWLNPSYNNNGSGPSGNPQELVYTFSWNANLGGNYLWPNFFLFKSNDRPFEVHVFGYPPTRIADINLLSTGGDASIRRWDWTRNFTLPNAFYRSYQNLPWGIEFFEPDFPVSREGFQISQAYPFIVRWAESGGFSNRSWRYFPDNSRIFRLP